MKPMICLQLKKCVILVPLKENKTYVRVDSSTKEYHPTGFSCWLKSPTKIIGGSSNKLHDGLDLIFSLSHWSFLVLHRILRSWESKLYGFFTMNLAIFIAGYNFILLRLDLIQIDFCQVFKFWEWVMMFWVE